MATILATYEPGKAWYIPEGSKQGEFPVSSVLLVDSVPNDRGYQYGTPNLLVTPGVDWKSLVEVTSH